MWSLFQHRTRTAQPARRTPHSSRPRLEVLEDRCLLNAGTLDPTFGSGGIVTTSLRSSSNNSSSNNYGDHIVVQPDGKIICVGEVVTSSKNGGAYQYGLARYNPNGTLDTTFGTNGMVIASSNYTTATHGLWDVALQPDGKIDVKSYESWTIYQYNANGTLDTTFGNNGQATIPFSGNGGAELPYDLVIEPPAAGSSEGQIVVVGTVNGNAAVVGMARLNPGGSLDTTFGNGGTVTVSLGPSTGYFGWFSSVALQSDGKIVVAGSEGPTSPTTTSNPQSVVVTRYNTNGSLDTSFGSGGIVATSPGLLAHQGNSAVLIQPGDGKIIAVGTASDSTGMHGTLIRYNTDGSLDTSFGNGGSVTTAGFGYRDAALGSDGNIFVAGKTGTGSFVVGRYFDQATTINGVSYAAGSFDPTFGTDGLTTTSVGVSGSDSGEGIGVQSDGKILVAGWSQIGSYNEFTVLRYLASAPQIGSFVANPNPVTAGSSVTLTASNITDGNPGVSITQVAFYLDSNNDGTLEPGTDQLLGYATQTSPGVWTLTNSSAFGLTAGTYRLFAQAEDSDGVFGTPIALTLTVQ